MIELIEDIEDVSFFEESHKSYSPYVSDVLIPLLGRLSYRAGRAEDALWCFEIYRCSHMSNWGEAPLEWILDHARDGLESKRWLFNLADVNSNSEWEQKRDSYIQMVRSSGIGEDGEDFLGIGKACFSMGQWRNELAQSSPQGYDDFNIAKEYHKRALLHLRLAIAVFRDDSEGERSKFYECLYWCGRAALEVGESEVAITCLEKMYVNSWNPDCEKWLENARSQSH